MRTALGWAAETINSLARLSGFSGSLFFVIVRYNIRILRITVFRYPEIQKSCVSTELKKRSSNRAAQIALLAANNNTHLQLASSNNFRSNIVLRQPAVQGVQLVRTSDELLCGKYIWSKSKCKKEIKLQQLRENDEQASPKTLTSVFASETTSC